MKQFSSEKQAVAKSSALLVWNEGVLGAVQWIYKKGWPNAVIEIDGVEWKGETNSEDLKEETTFL